MNLREIRDSRGITVKFVCKNLGICPRHYYRIEKSGLYLTEDRVLKLSTLFSTNITDIRNCQKREEGV